MDTASFLAQHQLPPSYQVTAQRWFNPLAEKIVAHHQGATSPFFVGVNGCQGSGKSTLCDYLSFYLSSQYNLNVEILSLDDFYLDKAERQSLANTVHPLLATRGVPGTHNTSLAKKTLTLLHHQQPVPLPRFNKATDNPFPKNEWPVINKPVDIVLVEGWCWGVTPQQEGALMQPVNKLEEEEDPAGIWRRFVNTQLAGEYQELFAQMQYWIMLKGPSFKQVYQWRLEQEHKLAARVGKDNSGVMSDQQVARFIQHYQRLTEHSLATLPQRCDHVFVLDHQRQIEKVLTPIR